MTPSTSTAPATGVLPTKIAEAKYVRECEEDAWRCIAQFEEAFGFKGEWHTAATHPSTQSRLQSQREQRLPFLTSTVFCLDDDIPMKYLDSGDPDPSDLWSVTTELESGDIVPSQRSTSMGPSTTPATGAPRKNAGTKRDRELGWEEYARGCIKKFSEGFKRRKYTSPSSRSQSQIQGERRLFSPIDWKLASSLDVQMQDPDSDDLDPSELWDIKAEYGCPSYGDGYPRGVAVMI